MLDKQDLQAISTIVREEISKNNDVILPKIFAVMDQKFEENNKKIIHAVAEMLEDNVIPQLA